MATIKKKVDVSIVKMLDIYEKEQKYLVIENLGKRAVINIGDKSVERVTDVLNAKADEGGQKAKE